MALTYTGRVVGQIKVKQDEKIFKLQCRESNGLICCLHVYKEEKPENPKLPWRHTLIMFFADETHLKNCREKYKFTDFFCGEILEVKLNIAYKNNMKILTYIAESVKNVKVYYEKLK